MLRFTDLTLAVESEAAYGLLGAAARAGIPYLQQALADQAVVDLKPFAADAKKKIGLALADFEKAAKACASPPQSTTCALPALPSTREPCA
jgi:hypothetical protein